MSKKANLIILIVSILIIVIVVGAGIVISHKKEKEATLNNTEIKIEDVDNVSLVDEKLKEGDYRVTQAYLLNYTRRKGSVWYRSKGIVTKIKYDDLNAIVTITSEDNKSKKVVANIDKDNINVKEKDHVYFVGTIDLRDGAINLAKISKEEIDYNNVVDMTLAELEDNIYYLKNTYVIVSGYMITVGDKYKLYSSKTEYKKDEEASNYFLIEWQDEFNYTGTSDVLLRCFIGDRFKLIGCELEN